MNNIIPEEHEFFFDSQLINFFDSDFSIMNESQKAAALERWTVDFLYKYTIANGLI